MYKNRECIFVDIYVRRSHHERFQLLHSSSHRFFTCSSQSLVGETNFVTFEISFTRFTNQPFISEIILCTFKEDIPNKISIKSHLSLKTSLKLIHRSQLS